MCPSLVSFSAKFNTPIFASIGNLYDSLNTFLLIEPTAIVEWIMGGGNVWHRLERVPILNPDSRLFLAEDFETIGVDNLLKK